jgi:uroporphyrinogen-III synthase
MPLIEAVDLATEPEIEAAVASLGAGDWLVATSVHAARRVAAAAQRSTCRVAAVGRTTAAALPRVDLVPTDQSAVGLLAVFPAAHDGGRAVVAQAAGGAPTLLDGLVDLGWRAVRVDTHISRSVVPDARQQLAALAADAVIFTSGSQARAWVEVFGTTAPALVATLGRETERNAEACGLKVDVVATDHSLSGVVRALQGIVKP